jgi:secreted trypsin-like serine protease
MLLTLLMLGGCTGTTVARESPSGARLEPRPRSSSMRFLILKSEGEDLDNRYLSTVVVGEYPALCSGVLIHPHLVLTAAHCVCPPTSGGKRVDTTTCAKRTEVTSYAYSRNADVYEMVPQTRQGTVRPHENFEALLDDDMAVMGATSDLAVILLEKPLERVPLSFQLTNSTVEIDDEFVVVGYGRADAAGQNGGRRLFGRNTVTQKGRSNLTNMKDKDIVFLFERRGAHAFAGDSGGPCFREDGQGRWLVGIVSQGNGRVSRFTSLYPHLLWLKDQIGRAEQLAEQARSSKSL